MAFPIPRLFEHAGPLGRQRFGAVEFAGRMPGGLALRLQTDGIKNDFGEPRAQSRDIARFDNPATGMPAHRIRTRGDLECADCFSREHNTTSTTASTRTP